jgi:hypothetical protein
MKALILDPDGMDFIKENRFQRICMFTELNIYLPLGRLVIPNSTREHLCSFDKFIHPVGTMFDIPSFLFARISSVPPGFHPFHPDFIRAYIQLSLQDKVEICWRFGA